MRASSAAIASFATRDAQHAAELKAEQAKTEKAIAAFSALADRLDVLAAERDRQSGAPDQGLELDLASRLSR